jgi:hypothetical protein
MKNLVFFLVVALNGTLNAQNTFEDGVMSELSKWHLTLKKGDNDSLTFALMPTLFSDPSTKYEFAKINPRIVDEVFVSIRDTKGNFYEITFTEWITKHVRVLDISKWNISFYTSKHVDFRTQYIVLDNFDSGESTLVFFNYNNDSPDKSPTNLISIGVQPN